MICDRCGEKCGSLTGSYFNTDMICMNCNAAERQHPKYAEARRVEGEHVRNGNYNFEGIGLPASLRPK